MPRSVPITARLPQIVSIFVLLASRLDALKVVVHGDAGLLRRMIRNLLANAKRHGGDWLLHDAAVRPAALVVDRLAVCT